MADGPLLDRSSSFSPANQGGACRGPDNGSSACRQESHHLLMMTSQYLMKSSAKKYHHINSDDIMEELAAKLSKTIILDCENEKNEAAASPRITDVKSFDEQIERICETLFQTLTSKQFERTYQRCLAIDLRQAGIQVLAEEAEIKLQYKGEQVATRKADIVLQTPSDKQWIVLELKAVRNLSSEHLKQLQFYMHHLDIDIGYLINFPHDTGFPDLPATAMYRQTILSGITEVLSDRNTRASNANAQVQIIKVERVITDNDSRAASPCIQDRVIGTVESVTSSQTAPLAKSTVRNTPASNPMILQVSTSNVDDQSSISAPSISDMMTPVRRRTPEVPSSSGNNTQSGDGSESVSDTSTVADLPTPDVLNMLKRLPVHK